MLASWPENGNVVISSLLWPLIVCFLIFYFRKHLLKLIDTFFDGKLNIKISGFELNLKENSIQQGHIILDLQSKLVEMGKKIHTLHPNSEKILLPNIPMKKKVLWVDDNPSNNSYLIETLKINHIDVDTSLSTSDAIEKIKSNNFDVIISDMGRPEDDRAGITLTKKIRDLKIQTPIFIFCGNWASTNLREEAKKAGVTDITSSGTELLIMLPI
ncbi:response regulator [Proteus mirabilis]|nr:response regulator [Proteus mirabilis]EKY1726571.1 response regulator [Proteus mirabilis]MDE8640993.1 response regulator [Proteus mirabilis]SFH41292.1 Response regulator receiver domain-containing protein [Proteus mirabilis]HCT9023924.1 response regulator [Proteus mirabilis]HCU0191601.1 response regulator [Proteus mirabilis]